MGISNALVLSGINKLEYVNYNESNQDNTVVEAVSEEDLNRTQHGFLFGVGLKRNKFSIEGRIEKGSHLINSNCASSTTDRVCVLLGWRL